MTSVLIATTEGLTSATTSAKLGNARVLLSGGVGVQLGSIGVVMGLVGGLGGGEVSMLDGRQPLARKRHKIIIRQVDKYFIFIPFIADDIVACRRD